MHIINTSHRGNYPGLPENSLAGFQAALTHGAEAIELDVRLCASGEAVVVHDRTLRRIAHIGKRVSRMSLTELEQVTIGTHQPITTLDALLAALQHTTAHGGPRVYIELKGFNPHLANVVVNTIKNWCAKRAYSYDTLLIISLNGRLLRKVTAQDPQIITGLSIPPFPLPAALIIRRAQAIGATMVNPHYRFLTRQFVTAMHAQNIAVNVWPVNTLRDMRRIVSLGVDCIMTDNTAQLAAILNKPQIR